MILLLMGVAGAGKTTVGGALQKTLGWPYLDADDFHSAANRAKMANGIPLQDEDRWPWLDRIAQDIRARIRRGESAIVGCSALKESYRKRLLIDPQVKLVYLKGGKALMRKRLANRRGHYMKAGMVDSQFEALEEPKNAVVIDAAHPAAKVVRDILAKLRPSSEE